MKDQQPGRDVERMREMLARVVPDSPDEPGRARSVADRPRSRRRRGIGAAAIAGLAAAVIVIPPVFLDSSPVSNDADQDPAPTAGSTPDDTSTTTADQPAIDPFATNPCPPDPNLWAGCAAPSMSLPTS